MDTTDTFKLSWISITIAGMLGSAIIWILFKIFFGKTEGKEDKEKTHFQGYIEMSDGESMEDWRPDDEELDEIDRGRGVDLFNKKK